MLTVSPPLTSYYFFSNNSSLSRKKIIQSSIVQSTNDWQGLCQPMTAMETNQRCLHLPPVLSPSLPSSSHQSPITNHQSPATSHQSPTPSRPFSSPHTPMNLPHPHPPTRSSAAHKSAFNSERLPQCTRLLSLTPTLLYLCFQPTRTRLACPTPH